jgi:hypothetical protein
VASEDGYGAELRSSQNFPVGRLRGEVALPDTVEVERGQVDINPAEDG